MPKMEELIISNGHETISNGSSEINDEDTKPWTPVVKLNGFKVINGHSDLNGHTNLNGHTDLNGHSGLNGHDEENLEVNGHHH